jgi:hypothetical protein
MPLTGLTAALAQNWQVFAKVDFPEGTNLFLAFRTDRPLTRREVLQKLARETRSTLRVRYCGDAATFLFGAYPCFTSLDRPEPTQQIAAPESSPVPSSTSATNGLNAGQPSGGPATGAGR